MIFLASQAVTLFGSTLVQMAIVWYVTLNTGEGAWIAAFTVASYLPQFLISFLGGVWADRYNKKALIIGADAGIAVVTLAMWLCLPYLGETPLMLLLLLTMSALRSVGAGIQTPAVNALLPQLVPQGDLMRYNGINATMQSVVQFAAPAAAGVLLSFSTLRSVLLIDVVTAGIGVGILSFVSVPRQFPSEKTSIFADMKVGTRYVRSDKLLSTLLLTYGLFIFFSVPAGFLAQLFVSRTFGETYWYLTAVEVVGFLGMMTGGILMSTWGGFKKRRITLVSGLAVFGFIGVVMAVSGHFILYIVLMFVYGIPLTMIQTAVTTMIQENAEKSMQGRMFGLLGTMYSGFLPIGMAIFGPLADVIPLPWIMIGSGVVLILLATFLLMKKKVLFDSN
ncbi:MAG: MFS transporter [Eubacteriales bacterium]|nr:MFS transporter [Eubacteriales bacterium]